MSLLYKTDFSKIPPTSITNNCLILDLDLTLIDTFIPTKENPVDSIEFLNKLGIMKNPKLMDLRRRTYTISMYDVVDKKGKGVKTEMWGITRPHIKEFLIFCFSYFKIVAVWSAGKKRYVEAIVDFLFRDIKRPHIIYTYNDLGGSHTDTLTKPIEKMIQEVTGLENYMTLKNTLIIDDNVKTFESVNPDNGILIPRYNPPWIIENLRKDDITLKNIINWLTQKEIISSKDIRNLDKSHIF